MRLVVETSEMPFQFLWQKLSEKGSEPQISRIVTNLGGQDQRDYVTKMTSVDIANIAWSTIMQGDSPQIRGEPNITGTPEAELCITRLEGSAETTAAIRNEYGNLWEYKGGRMDCLIKALDQWFAMY